MTVSTPALPLDQAPDEMLVDLIQSIRRNSEHERKLYPGLSNAAALAKATRLLYQRHERPLINYLHGLCQHSDLAMDIYQETWMRIWRTIDDWQPKARFSTFLYTVAKHCLSDLYFRKEQKRLFATHSLDDEDNGIAESLQSCQLSDELLREDRATEAYQHCLQQLPIHQREAFLLSHNHDMTAVEVSEVTGVIAETAKTRIRYALQKLRLCLGGLLE